MGSEREGAMGSVLIHRAENLILIVCLLALGALAALWGALDKPEVAQARPVTTITVSPTVSAPSQNYSYPVTPKENDGALIPI